MLPGLRSSLRLEGESMRSRASAASMVLSEQWTLVPWTEASTETYKVMIIDEIILGNNFTDFQSISVMLSPTRENVSTTLACSLI